MSIRFPYDDLCRYLIKTKRKMHSGDNFNLSSFTKLLKLSRMNNKGDFISCGLFLILLNVKMKGQKSFNLKVNIY